MQRGVLNEWKVSAVHAAVKSAGMKDFETCLKNASAFCSKAPHQTAQTSFQDTALATEMLSPPWKLPTYVCLHMSSVHTVENQNPTGQVQGRKCRSLRGH